LKKAAAFFVSEHQQVDAYRVIEAEKTHLQHQADV
jgi:hypothetical protein